MASFSTAKSSRSMFDSVAASPGVSLERGNYRMRAPNTRPLPSLFPSHETHTRRPSPRQQRTVNYYLPLLGILLAAGCLSCFATAYYLFSTRWATQTAYSSLSIADMTAQVIDSEETTCTSNDSQKYLWYLSHSGFHNQRIAFENALLLAYVLNRTLLVPPIRLGHKPIRYVEYDTLLQYHELSSKRGLSHCPHIPPYISRPPECMHYFESAYIPWTWLADLSPLAATQTLCHLPTMSSAWIGSHFNIDPSSDVYTLRDKTPYQFQFTDTVQGLPHNGKYQDEIHIGQLATVQEKLLQIGTLFGTSRLRLKSSQNLVYLKTVRQSMVFRNKDLSNAADSIAQALGSSYIALHLRSGDGLFQSKFRHTVNATWWRTLQDVIGLSNSEICDLESKLSTGPSPDCTKTPAQEDPELSLGTASHISFPVQASRLGINCRKKRHAEQHYRLLNVPLYVATDLSTPETHPQLSIFRHTFPCIFFLMDFKAHLEPLQQMESTYDGVNLYEFVLPFVDALVASKAMHVLGTEGSTFSKFVEDVLWASFNHDGTSRLDRVA